MWVGWEAVVVMVPDVSATWLCDGICPAAIITDSSIAIDESDPTPYNHLRDPAGDVNKITESISVLP